MYSEIHDYAYYDSLNSGPHHRRCIDGNDTGCGNCVGYCRYSGHPGFLTAELREEHNCIKNACRHYSPKTQQSHREKTKDSHPKEIEAVASEILSAIEGLKVLRAVKTTGGWRLNYVTITNGYSVREIEKSVSEAIGEKVIMQRINCDFDRAAKIIFA